MPQPLMRFCCLIAFIAVTIFSGAQKINLHISVKDSLQKRPLASATVILMGGKDSSLIDFGITDSAGHYYFKNIALAKAVDLVITLTGYQTLTVPLHVKPKTSKLSSDTIEILLAPDFHVLQDVAITAKATPIRMNGDTLEFSAGYFKARPNAVVEELLRKLPGIEVRQNGEIYANGQRVSKILVDGKEFFSSDPLVLLRNLPADIIEKIQVADEKNTVAKETRLQKDIPKTINLKLKKEIKGGMFGKFFGGYGTDDRYEAGGIANIFKDTLQMSIIASSNNQGRDGFSMDDLYNLGGFGRSGGLGQKGVSDFVSYGNSGIKKQYLAGANINYDFGKKLQINGQYFYKQSEQRRSDESYVQQFIADSSQLTNSSGTSLSKEHAHTASIGLKWKQDSTGYLTATIRGNLSANQSSYQNNSKTYSEKTPFISQSDGWNNADGNANDFTLNADYQKTFPKKKIDIQTRVGYSNTSNNGINNTATYYSQFSTGGRTDSTIQIRENLQPRQQLTASFLARKNWKKNHTLELASEYTNTHEDQKGGTFRISPLTGLKEWVPAMSVGLYQKRNLFNNTTSYRYNYKDFSMSAGVSLKNLLMQNSYNTDTIPTLNRTFNLVSPVININFKGVGIGFNQSIREPDSYALRPITDNTNPLYISSGNPNLKPATTSNISLQFYKYFTRAKINLNISSNYSNTKNGVASASTIFADGKTVSTYTNIDKAIAYSSNLYLNKSYNKNNWYVDLGIGVSASVDRRPILLNGNAFMNSTQYINGNVNGTVGWKNIIRWNPGYNYTTSTSKSQDTLTPKTNTRQHVINNALHWQIAPRLSWDVNLNYNLNPGAPEGYKKQWLFCDAAITWSLLKKEQAQVKISGFDVFNQNEGIFRAAYQNYIYDSKSLVQKRYFMLTLLYSIKKI